MSKYLKLFENHNGYTAYTADTANFVKPNVSYCVQENEVHMSPYIPPPPIYSAGTIVMYNNGSYEKAPYQDWNTSDYPINTYVPIGVVLVPNNHTQDGTTRILSLKNMSLSNPNGGTTVSGDSSTSADTSIYWGGYGSDIPTLTNFDKTVTVDPNNQSVTLSSQGSAFVPSNYTASTMFRGSASTTDEGSKYYSGTSSNNYAPSIYLTNGERNPIADNLTVTTANCLTDMDGYTNTQKILAVDNAASTDWQTASTISNVARDSATHPAAQCCWRYTTVGVETHKWYLPSCGELAYLPSRYADINAALTKLMTADPTIAVKMWSDGEVENVYGSFILSSTEYSVNNARYCNLGTGLVGFTSRRDIYGNNRVRAVAALNL